MGDLLHVASTLNRDDDRGNEFHRNGYLEKERIREARSLDLCLCETC